MQNYNNNNSNQTLDWDSTITADAQEFVILKPGEYDFTVNKIEKKWYAGSANLPACNKAEVYLSVQSPEGTASVIENLYLVSKSEWRISQFFTSIGMKKEGQPFKMDFDNAVGKSGRATFSNREYNGKTYNEVKDFLKPTDTNSSASFAPGQY